MPDFLNKISETEEEELRAEARSEMFFTLRKAFKARCSDEGVRVKDIAAAVGKDEGYVSRVLNGSAKGITFETLFVFLHALRHHVALDPVPYEELESRRCNFDARPVDSSAFVSPTLGSQIFAADPVSIRSNVPTLNLGGLSSTSRGATVRRVVKVQ